MVPIIAGLLLLWLGSVMMREFLQANPAAVARRMKQGGGFAALLAALFLLMRGRIDLAFGLAGVGLWLTTGQKAPNWGSLGRAARRNRSRVSRVRSTLIEMELDHGTGVMRGTVVGGAYAGRRLDDLDQGHLQIVYGQCLANDLEGARLLEAYFDRRFPGWREAGQDGSHARASGEARRPSPRQGGMSEQEAYQLLGLAKGASREDISSAHRSMMKKFHPDHGGSTDMAARVNEAKDVLMRRHPRDPQRVLR